MRWSVDQEDSEQHANTGRDAEEVDDDEDDFLIDAELPDLT